MGDKKFQRILDRMGKAKGNTVSIEDGPQEVHEFIKDNAKNPGQAQDAYIAGKDTFNKAPQRKSALNMLGVSRKASPFNFKGANSENSDCWDTKVKVGTQPSPSGTGETVNKCMSPEDAKAYRAKKNK